MPALIACTLVTLQVQARAPGWVVQGGSQGNSLLGGVTEKLAAVWAERLARCVDIAGTAKGHKNIWVALLLCWRTHIGGAIGGFPVLSTASAASVAAGGLLHSRGS